QYLRLQSESNLRDMVFVPNHVLVMPGCYARLAVFLVERRFTLEWQRISCSRGGRKPLVSENPFAESRHSLFDFRNQNSSRRIRVPTHHRNLVLQFSLTEPVAEGARVR